MNARGIGPLHRVPSRARQQPGARLIALVREEVARQGYAQLYITVAAQNHDALRFYERQGLVPAFVVLRDAQPGRP